MVSAIKLQGAIDGEIWNNYLPDKNANVVLGVPQCRNRRDARTH